MRGPVPGGSGRIPPPGPGYHVGMLTRDHVVLVTGASSGLGRAVAQAAARRGSHLVLVARGSAALQEAAVRCADSGAASTQVLPADVGDHEQVHRVVARVLERHGRLDAVVNAAGVIAVGPTLELPVDVHDGVIRTNLLGSANVARATLPVLCEQGGGTLVLIGSVLGHVTAPYVGPYVVSKWGVRALARQLRSELRGERGVRVGYVAPGGIDTPIYRQAANYLGFGLRPPPPVAPPERVARQVLDIVDGRRPRIDAGVAYTAANGTLKLAYHLLPSPLYDALARRGLGLIGVEQVDEQPPHPGNVRGPQQQRSRPYGDAGHPALAVARNLAAIATRRHEAPDR